MRRLRDEVADGLRVASFGARRVPAHGAHPRRPAGGPPPAARERLRRDHHAARGATSAPLTVFEDGLGLFEGLDSFIGDFTEFEQSRRLPTGARTIATAGRDPSEPAFVAFGLGGGIVIRSGTAAVGARAGRVGAERRGAGRHEADLAPAGRRREVARSGS